MNSAQPSPALGLAPLTAERTKLAEPWPTPKRGSYELYLDKLVLSLNIADATWFRDTMQWLESQRYLGLTYRGRRDPKPNEDHASNPGYGVIVKGNGFYMQVYPKIGNPARHMGWNYARLTIHPQLLHAPSGRRVAWELISRYITPQTENGLTVSRIDPCFDLLDIPFQRQLAYCPLKRCLKSYFNGTPPTNGLVAGKRPVRYETYDKHIEQDRRFATDPGDYLPFTSARDKHAYRVRHEAQCHVTRWRPSPAADPNVLLNCPNPFAGITLIYITDAMLRSPFAPLYELCVRKGIHGALKQLKGHAVHDYFKAHLKELKTRRFGTQIEDLFERRRNDLHAILSEVLSSVRR